MSLEFDPVLYTESYQRLLNEVPKSLSYLVSVVDMVVPLEFRGVEFRLKVSEPGIPVTIVIDRPDEAGLENPVPPKRLVVVPKQEVENIRVPLVSGVNRIRAISDVGDSSMRIGVAHWATWLHLFSNGLRGVEIRNQERQDAILSYTGSLLTERWFPEADLLPRSNSLHRLGMRMIVDGMRRSGTNIGIRKVVSGLTGSYPHIVSRQAPRIIEGPTTPLPTVGEDVAGVDIHLWLFDVCTMGFITAGRYIENTTEYNDVLQMSELAVSYRQTDTDTNHVMVIPTNRISCSTEDLLLSEGCFDSIRPFIRATRRKKFVICQASYILDTAVEICSPLGAVYWDCGGSLTTLVHDPDAVDEEDPTGDGWVGHALDGRFDYPYGGSFDTFGVIEGFLADQCPYEQGIVVTPLFTTATTAQIDIDMVAFGEYEINPVPSTEGEGAILTAI